MTIDFNTTAVLFPLLLLLLGLGYTIIIDSYIYRKQRQNMLIIIILCYSLIAQNLWEDTLFISRSNLMLKNVLSAYGYSVRPVILILCIYIIQPDRKQRLQWVLAGLNALLYCSSPFTKLCFWIRETDYASLRGPLWVTCYLISAILLAQLLSKAITCYRDSRKQEQLIPVFVVLLIIASTVLDFRVGMERQPVSFLTISIVIDSVFFYIWIHLQFVREHEQDLIAEQRIRIMMSQIQPHFLFNALNTIRALYVRNPALADRTLEDFSAYLRQNLESLSQADLVPITRELEHTRLYTEIEVLRFPNVHVEYRIEDTEFKIPALTIQPLVENAIRHGVRSCKDGLVTVHTVRETGVHRITIQDNGVGFDVKKQNAIEGTQIGLCNVKERIERMCGGTMVLQSTIGSGTRVTLLIPDDNQQSKRRNGNESSLHR